MVQDTGGGYSSHPSEITNNYGTTECYAKIFWCYSSNPSNITLALGVRKSNNTVDYIDIQNWITDTPTTYITPKFTLEMNCNVLCAYKSPTKGGYLFLGSMELRRTIPPTPKLIAGESPIVWYTKTIVNIGDITSILIWWVKDWDFFGGFNDVLTSASDKISSVTTWNITPWNFVGYLQVWDYKIPYYL